MATPSLAMIPSAIADSKVYSVLPNNGDGDFTFNRNSSATRVGQDGLIQTVGFFGNELVTNGTFDTNLNNWNVTLAGQTVEWDNGRVKYITDGALAFLEQTITTVIGRVYRATVDINVTSGEFVLNVGGQDIEGDGVQTLEMLFTATSTTTLFQLKRKPGAAASGYFDNATFKEVTGDQPRLNYDISNGQVQSCPSLLLEPASTNLITYSQDFSQWDKNSGTTVTINNAVSPDGTQNATSIVSAGTGSRVGLNVSITSGTTYTLSVYLKNNGGNTSVSIGSHGTTQLETITINNEWNRYTTTFTASSSTTSSIRIISSGSDINLYAFGSQLEALSYATSYIPTNGSSQTRAAETCNDAGTASTFNSTEGVLYAEIKGFVNDAVSRPISISDGTTSNRINLFFPSSQTQVVGRVSSGGVTVADMLYTGINQSLFNKIAVKYKANDFALWVNGVEVLTDTSGAAPIGLEELAFDNAAGTKFYGKCKDLRVYNEALTDAQLQTLTTL